MCPPIFLSTLKNVPVVIAIEGRTLLPVQLFDLPDKSTVPSYESLLSMLQRRCSIREFKDKPVEKEKIDQIQEAAQTASMGLPPSNVLVYSEKRYSCSVCPGVGMSSALDRHFSASKSIIVE